MQDQPDRLIGDYIGRLTRHENLNFEEAYSAFCILLQDRTTAMQQGAFLAALCAKGETAAEVAAAWQAIHDLDTIKLPLSLPDNLVENSGTGMDTYKTFNISTAASILASAVGIPMARHGARALSSRCGTVDLAEAIGVDVEAPPAVVCTSILTTGLGLFNGMSPQVHPQALGRILGQIHFGSTLNISASLANPARPVLGVRGVYAPDRLEPVAAVMRDIGYKRALVIHGFLEGHPGGMDEASVCGTTLGVELCEDGSLVAFSLEPEQLGLGRHAAGLLKPDTADAVGARNFLRTLAGKGCQARIDAVILNAACILKVAGFVSDISEAVAPLRAALADGRALRQARAWVSAQNRDPAAGLRKFDSLVGELA